VVATSVVVVELWEQLLARETELESMEGAIAAWEDGLVTFKHALGRVRTEHNASHIQAEAAQMDYLARMRAFSS
jgi:hypothetical protein